VSCGGGVELSERESEDPNLTSLTWAYSHHIRTADWFYEDFLGKPGALLRLVSYALKMVPLDQARDGDICEEVKEDLSRILEQSSAAKEVR
jgi:hypothetical protein